MPGDPGATRRRRASWSRARVAFADRSSRARSGLSLLELLIALPIVVAAGVMYFGAITATGSQRSIARENALAAEATRAQLERMRNEPLEDVFALYNADPADDPDGYGTAPGHRFAIAGLLPPEGVNDPRVAEVVFPVVEVSTTATAAPIRELREDVDDPALGMPRDLNRDHVIDDLDHSQDYGLLPVMVVARWEGRFGPREFRVYTVLTEYRY